MASITLNMKDGTIKQFPHEGRPGGSYTKTVKYEGEFCIIEDEWGNRFAFPAADIESVVERPNRSW